MWFYCEAHSNIEWNLRYTNSFILLLLLLLIIIIIINWRIVKDRENPFLAIFRQGCPQFYDFIFGQTIFRSSDCTAKNQP